MQIQVRIGCFRDGVYMNVLSLGLNTRDGTDRDATLLEGVFNGLGFDTVVYQDRTAVQILTIVEQGKIDLKI
jgi:hypothetical protein